MFTSYTLNDGRTVKTPLLDGVLERAQKLIDKWLQQKPELEAIPEYILMFRAIEVADMMRMLDAFRKAKIEENEALGYVHSHLPDELMWMGLLSFLGANTWFIEQNSADLTAFPSNIGLTEVPSEQDDSCKKRLTEEEIRQSAEFGKDLPESVGPEATEHLIHAVLAYDQWVREQINIALEEEKANFEKNEKEEE
jgi:hypothetical protein